MSAGVLGADRPDRKLAVWNWHGDTNGSGELIPRVLYKGPPRNIGVDSSAATSKRAGHPK